MRCWFDKFGPSGTVPISSLVNTETNAATRDRGIDRSNQDLLGVLWHRNVYQDVLPMKLDDLDAFSMSRQQIWIGSFVSANRNL